CLAVAEGKEEERPLRCFESSAAFGSESDPRSAHSDHRCAAVAGANRFSATTGAAADKSKESRSGFVVKGRTNTTARGKMLDATGGGGGGRDGANEEPGGEGRVV